jgi:G:T-mismatch repair DNA endonuclease (very short patch repair protein)
VLRKRFLKPDTIGLIPSGGYSGNVNYCNKAMMWLVYRERTDGCTILHARNGREFRPPEHPNLSVDGICPETKNVYEFLGCFYRGDTCQPFRDVTTLRGDTLAERYEKTMARLQHMTSVGYTVEVVWECQFAGTFCLTTPNLNNIPKFKAVHLILATRSTGVEPSPWFSTIRSVRERRFNIMT